MSSVQTIEVHTAPAYEVTIGAGLLRECGARLKTVLGGCRIAVTADSNVAPLYLETVCASLRDAGFAVCSYVFPAGEAHKNFTTLSAILEFLAQQHLTRTDCVAALGGGVTGDMAGFAAAERDHRIPTVKAAVMQSGQNAAVGLHVLASLSLRKCENGNIFTLRAHRFRILRGNARIGDKEQTASVRQKFAHAGKQSALDVHRVVRIRQMYADFHIRSALLCFQQSGSGTASQQFDTTAACRKVG